MANEAFRRLVEYLETLPPGPVTDPVELGGLLAECWDVFDGGTAEDMAAWKVKRLERVDWNPPRIELVVERHGEVALGAKRAELRGWTVDIGASPADFWLAGYRQVKPQQPALDTRGLAKEVADSIVGHRRDARLKRYPDGTVRVLIGQVIPDGSAVKQTLQGRRKRFHGQLEVNLRKADWRKIKQSLYAPPITAPGGIR